MYFKLLAGKHHTGWERKIDELTNLELRDVLTKAGIEFSEKDKRERLVTLVRQEVGTLIDDRRSYTKGDIIKSETDLRRFNDAANPLNSKFELVNEHGQAIGDAEMLPETTKKPIHASSLNSQTIQQLRNLAEAEEIDLGATTRKDEIIKILRSAEAVA